MGCGNSKVVKAIASRPLKTNSFDRPSIYKYYVDNEKNLPKRIRDLFNAYLGNQASTPVSIDLKFINLSDKQLKSLIVVLPTFTQLRALNLWKTKLGNDGCIAICSYLQCFPHLSFLSLADNLISYYGIVAFTSKFVCLKELEVLELYINPFENDTTKLLAKNMHQLTNLRLLNVDECEMEDQGLSDLILALSACKHLERLSINYNRVGEKLNNMIVGVVNKLKGLKRLSALNTGINSATQEALKSVYPDILFSFS